MAIGCKGFKVCYNTEEKSESVLFRDQVNTVRAKSVIECKFLNINYSVL